MQKAKALSDGRARSSIHRAPAARVYRFLRSIPTWVLWVLVGVWLTPTLGLLVNSFRDPRRAARPAGWWNVLLGNWDGFTLDNYRTVLEHGPERRHAQRR